MSRLIVKNLPAYATPVRLKQHFEQKGGPGGTITDFKVALKSDGTSRRFGFLGYKTEKEALKAKEWFDRTYIDSARISVDVIEGSKNAPTPRPNKRPRQGPSPMGETSSENQTNKPSTKPKSEKPTAAKDLDATFDEFMIVMQPRNKNVPRWANEPQPDAVAVPMDVPDAENRDEGPVVDGAARDETISDLEWMKLRMAKTAGVDADEKRFEQSDEEQEAGPSKSTQQDEEAPEDPTIETIKETSRLFLRNLAFSCTEADIVELFSPYGKISQVHIPVDISTKQPKGVAYVTYAQSSDAIAAYQALDKKSFQGRLLHILAAVNRRSKAEVEEAEGRKNTVKGEKQAKRRKEAAKEFNWSMLYMNSDAVASSIADRFQIQKSDILNPDPGSGSIEASVKLALAETHIIQETKTYLTSHGVSLESFSSTRTPRSDTIILVKNIPYGTTQAQIQEMFEPHGELEKVLVPPAGTIAIVEFKKPDEAWTAFKAVAYRRLGNSVVYLEKGPLGMFDGSLGPTDSSTPTNSNLGVVKISEKNILDAAGEDEAAEPSITGGSTLYIKNLSFSTTQDCLTSAFRHLPSFSFARVQTKPDPKHPDGPRLSMGFGFIGFENAEGAKKAMLGLQGFVLDGHQLVVKFAGRGTEEDTKKGAVGRGSKTTKMIVKNVPFEASKKDLQALFGTHGHLKSVRLPKRFDSRTRGFAFLDFVSRAEAENAYAALRHTHLLGRHLVLEWAEEGEQDLEALRKKAGVGFGDGKFIPGRKRKLDLGKTGEEDVESLEV